MRVVSIKRRNSQKLSCDNYSNDLLELYCCKIHIMLNLA